MQFELSETIEKYIAARGKIFLNACPGSGKTTTIAYKLSQLTSEWDDQFGKFSGIACLSFTNIAKDEINQKYAEFSETPLKFPHLVSTIDSFINQYITLPFFYLFEANAERPRIVEDSNIINTAWKHYFNQNKKLQKQLKNKAGQSLHYSYPPFDIHVELDNSFTFAGRECNPEKVDPSIFTSYCKTVKKWQIRQKGLLAIHDSAYIAVDLLRRFPRVGQWLAKRFPIIIVDEAQDTSEIQLDILERIANSGLRSLELVGDPYQCLYEWRNASPEMLVERTNDTSWTAIPLNDNRRSQSKIIRCFSQLRKKGDAEINPITKFSIEYPILVVKYNKSNEYEAVEKFLSRIGGFSENHVVVRGRSLRDKLLGNKRPSTGKPLWKSSLPEILIHCKKSFDSYNIKQGVNRLRAELPAILEPKSDINRRRELEDELKEDYSVNALLFGVVRNLPSLGFAVNKWTEETQDFLFQSLSDHFTVKSKIDFQLKAGEYKKFYDQSIEEIYGEQVIAEIPISTIHQVKGMTCDTLLLIMSPDSKGANISVKDINQPVDFPSEKQRMIYVAMSRPRHLLAIGVPNDIPEETLYQKLGNAIEIV